MKAAGIARRGSVSTSKAISFELITTTRLWTQKQCGGLLSSPRIAAAPGILSCRNTLISTRLFTTTMAPSSEHVTPGTGAVQNAWIGEKGSGAFDLRSDVLTVPTPSMLAAIQTCTMKDDVFREDPTTMDLEAHIARMTGKEAGLFVVSGTMGNQLALRSALTQPPHSVLCDLRSHIWQYEAGGVSSLSGAMLVPISPKNGIHITLEEVKSHIILSDDVHACPTRVISLENTLNGMIMPLSEIQRISAFARSHGIHMHCDGARLWEAVAAGAATLPEFCKEFDTISLCFSKGLGAPIGSMLVGTQKLLKHAMWVRKSIGGGTRQPGLLTAAARVAVDETFGPAVDGSKGILKKTHEMAKRVEEAWTRRGGKLIHPAHTNMVWLDLDAAGCEATNFVAMMKVEGLGAGGSRLVTHYQVAQRGDEVMERLERVFDKVFQGEGGAGEAKEKIGQDSMYTTR